MQTNPSRIHMQSTLQKQILLLAACGLAAGSALGSTSMFSGPVIDDSQSLGASDGNPLNWGSANNPGKISFEPPGEGGGGKLSGGGGGIGYSAGFGQADHRAGPPGSGEVDHFNSLLITLHSGGSMSGALVLTPLDGSYSAGSGSDSYANLGGSGGSTSVDAAGGFGSDLSKFGTTFDLGASHGSGGFAPGAAPAPGAVVILGAAAALRGRRRR